MQSLWSHWLPASRGRDRIGAQATWRLGCDRRGDDLSRRLPDPRGWIGELQHVPIEELAQLEIWRDGRAVELEGRDIHISVDGLTANLPAMRVAVSSRCSFNPISRP